MRLKNHGKREMALDVLERLPTAIIFGLVAALVSFGISWSVLVILLHMADLLTPAVSEFTDLIAHMFAILGFIAGMLATLPYVYNETTPPLIEKYGSGVDWWEGEECLEETGSEQYE